MVKLNIFELVIVGIITLVAIVVLVNPGAGIIDLIPDNLPLIGNMDEAVATLWLGGILVKFFNIDPSKITTFFVRG